MRTPRRVPAVPGALGRNPSPNPVARRIPRRLRVPGEGIVLEGAALHESLRRFLHQAQLEHGLSNFDESRNIGPSDVVSLHTVFLGRGIA